MYDLKIGKYKDNYLINYLNNCQLFFTENRLSIKRLHKKNQVDKNA